VSDTVQIANTVRTGRLLTITPLYSSGRFRSTLESAARRAGISFPREDNLRVILSKALDTANNGRTIVGRRMPIFSHFSTCFSRKALPMPQLFVLVSSEDGQDIAEYAVMVAVILIIVVGTLRLIGSNSNTVFSSVASAIG
jgi:Flp pilus assembly pilin Flp